MNEIKNKIILGYSIRMLGFVFLVISAIICLRYTNLLVGGIIGAFTMSLFMRFSKEDSRFCLRVVMACTLGGVSIVLFGMRSEVPVPYNVVCGILMPLWLVSKTCAFRVIYGK